MAATIASPNMISPTVAEAQQRTEVRPLTARELVEVRDLSSLTISPDEQTAVVRLHEPSVERNDVALSWYVVPLITAGPASLVVNAGAPIRNGGLIGPEPPQWSHDSEWFYYRALLDTEVQLMRARRDGTATERLTDDAADIESFVLDSEADRVFYLAGATRAAIREADRRDYEKGVLYDGTRRTAAGNVPRLDAAQPRLRVLDLTTRSVHDASDAERETYSALSSPPRVASASTDVRSVDVEPAGERITFLEYLDARPTGAGREATLARLASPPKFQVRWAVSAAAEQSTRCTASPCSGSAGQLVGSAWRPGTDEILIFTRGPYGSSEMSVYAFDTRSAALRTVTSGGSLSGGRGVCPIAGDKAICIAASAAQPPQLQGIDLRTGERHVLFDPNPHLDGSRFGPVEVFEWSDAEGHRFHGHLLLPPQPQARTNLPLVITTYRCDGFLRGGTGDEYPEHLFAAAGLAVLCSNHDNDRTVGVDADGNPLTIPGMKINVAGWEAAIDSLARRGIVDPSRVGLTGLSYGARNTLYAISHSDRFAAVSTSSGSDLEPSAMLLRATPGSMSSSIRYLEGMPYVLDDPDGIWERVSPSRNAARIRAPVLVQVADSEFHCCGLLELRSYMLHENKPMEIVIFPDETHQKWQPVHKYFAYERNVDWFRFWLQGHEDPDPEKASQYERWRQLRSPVQR